MQRADRQPAERDAQQVTSADDPPAPGGGTRPGGRAHADTRPAEGLRVVVVEDEAIIAMELEDMLAELGAKVVGTAPSAARAIELAGVLRPDCMTMDIRIQGPRDGISAAIEIYERFGIRSAFVSAFGNPETAARAQTAHPLGWVTKPIRKADLARVLGEVARDRGR
jgi:AmiR/NasT family two-component response regulator